MQFQSQDQNQGQIQVRLVIRIQYILVVVRVSQGQGLGQGSCLCVVLTKQRPTARVCVCVHTDALSKHASTTGYVNAVPVDGKASASSDQQPSAQRMQQPPSVPQPQSHTVYAPIDTATFTLLLVYLLNHSLAQKVPLSSQISFFKGILVKRAAITTHRQTTKSVSNTSSSAYRLKINKIKQFCNLFRGHNSEMSAWKV